MPSLLLSDANMGFAEQLGSWSYTMQRPWVATRRFEFINRRVFPVAAVDQVYNHSIVWKHLRRCGASSSPS